jgi:hypothetical protein
MSERDDIEAEIKRLRKVVSFDQWMEAGCVARRAFLDALKRNQDAGQRTGDEPV